MESGHRVMLSRATMVAAKDSVIVEVKKRIEELGLLDDFDIKEREITCKSTGSSVFFKGLQTSRGSYTAALKSLAGVTTFILDEAEELIDEEVFDKIDLSIRTKDKQNRVILAFNPPTKEIWFYERFYLLNGWDAGKSGTKKNVTYVHSTWEDIKHVLSDSVIDRFEEIKRTDPDKYKHVVVGAFRDKAEGVVFDNWELLPEKWIWDDRGIYDPTDKDMLTRWKHRSDGNDIIYGQDYGYYPDATTLVKVLIDDYNKVLYVHECFYKHKLDTEDIGALNAHWAGPKDLIVADNAEPRLINELQKHCNIVDCKKGPDSVTAGIQKMRDYKIIVTPDSTNIIKELNNYIWDDKKIDKPVKGKWDHTIDAIRYAVMYELLDSYSDDYYVY